MLAALDVCVWPRGPSIDGTLKTTVHTDFLHEICPSFITPPRFPHRGVGPALGVGAPIHNDMGGAGFF